MTLEEPIVSEEWHGGAHSTGGGMTIKKQPVEMKKENEKGD